ncbi:MAG: pyridoxal phosphate-dependent aminotransferase [Fusobacteriaceae bacterium]
MELSKRIKKLKTSPVRKLVPYAETAVKKGKKIIYLNIGQPDIETPKEFFEAIANSHEKVLKYAHSAGLKDLIKGIQKYYARFDMKYDESEILITCGGSEALQFVLVSLCDEEDEILIAEPYYANYNSFFDLLGIKLNAVKTFAEEGFHFPDLKKIEEKITKKTKAIMITNPNNPTGTVYTIEEMDNIAYLAKKYNLYIISDEVYREFTYGKNEAISFGKYEKLNDRVIIIDSISKRFSACGARIGCVISKNKEFMSEIYKLCQARLSAPTLEMIGGAALYNLPDNFFDISKIEYEKRRELIYKGLSSIEGVLTTIPEGAFYCIAKLPVDDSEKFIIWLLSEFDIDGETVMMAPAEGFYYSKGCGLNEVRISYAINLDDLARAIRIIKEGLKKYKDIK